MQFERFEILFDDDGDDDISFAFKIFLLCQESWFFLVNQLGLKLVAYLLKQKQPECRKRALYIFHIQKPLDTCSSSRNSDILTLRTFVQ